MSVQSEINRLNAIKERMRINLVAQGITVPADAMLEEMATMVLSVAGYTPQKGVDYWTPADQEAIVQQVITALGTPVFGRVDAENNIILTGELADCIYTVKYEDADGEKTDIGTLSRISYINQIPISTDTDGSIFNGTGYKTGSRCNSSGAVASVDVPTAAKAPIVTGFIPCKQGDIIRLKNCYIPTDNGGTGGISDNTNAFGSAFWGIRNGLYNAAKAKVDVFSWGDIYDKLQGNNSNLDSKLTNIVASNNRVTQFTVAHSEASYIRITLATDGSPVDAILTVNEPIE